MPPPPPNEPFPDQARTDLTRPGPPRPGPTWTERPRPNEPRPDQLDPDEPGPDTNTANEVLVDEDLLDEELVDELLAVATAAATAAATLVQAEAGGARRDISAKSSPTDLVSEVDRAAEHCVVTTLTRSRPHDAILAEEGTSRPGTTGVRWVIDPLDGTTNFLFGLPAYAVSVAAEIDGRATVGVVVDPSRNETWQARRSRGATLNGRALRLGVDPPPPATALVATGFSYLPDRRAYQAKVVAHLLPRVRDIRRLGAAALDLCWVAAGRVSAFYELGLQPWDLAAGVLIAEEAGAQALTLADGTMLVAPPGLVEALRHLIEAGAST